jgi:uncharacterized protein
VEPVSPLLDLQELDLVCDRLRADRAALPERAALRLLEEKAPVLDAAHEALRAQRGGLAESEHGLSAEVAELAARAKTVEATLYSGTVRVSKELSALQEEIRLFRVRQAEIEVREMALLEEIDRVEGEIAENRASRAALSAEARAVIAALRKGEAAIDVELTKLGGEREAKLAAVSSGLLATYDKLRDRERLHGRAVARLADGGCSGCHMKLPVLEYNTMKAQPQDALLLCVHCGRMLVR